MLRPSGRFFTPRSTPDTQRFVDVDQGESQEAARWIIDEGICARDMVAIGRRERGKQHPIDAGEQFLRLARGVDLAEKCVERTGRRIILWNRVEARRGTSHLGDPPAQRIDVLGALPLV